LFNYPAGSALTTANYINTPTPPLFILEPNPNSFELIVGDYRKSSNISSLPKLLQQTNFIDYKLHLTADDLKKVGSFSSQ
jgi:hypothetical protein